MKTFVRLNIKKVILTVVVLAVVVLVICGVCMRNKFNAWADSGIVDDNTSSLSAVSEDTETVKRTVYSTKKSLPYGGASSLSKYLNDYQNQFSHFEYVVGIPSEYPCNYSGFTGLTYVYNFYSDEECISYSLSFQCYYGIDLYGEYNYDSFYYLGYGMYMQETTEIFDLYASESDGLYLTLTDESLFFSYYSGYSGYSDDEYRDSLSNILTVFYKGSPEYNLFYEYILSSDGYFLLFSDIRNEGPNYVELNTAFESVTLFNYEEVPKKEGYTFTGWYYDEACTQKCDGGFVDSSVKLYAGYEINKYTVTYYGGLANDSNEAGLYDRVDEVEHGGIADYIPPIVEGATFAGWYYENGTKYEDTPITQDTTLYGHWESETYTVTLDFNGGTSEGGNVYTVERGNPLIHSLIVREGYTFVGWRIIGEYGMLGDMYYGAGVYSDMNLQAVWKRNLYTVKLYIDNNLYEKVEVFYGETFSWDSDINIKEGQSLVGWFFDRQCDNENEHCRKYEYTPVKENLSLHGHFEVSKYTVNFYLDGEIVKTEIVEYGTGFSSLSALASDNDLRVLSIHAADGGALSNDFVSCDINVETEEMSGFDKFLNGLKKNKWKVVGGVAGVVVIIVLLCSLPSLSRRKKK